MFINFMTLCKLFLAAHWSQKWTIVCSRIDTVMEWGPENFPISKSDDTKMSWRRETVVPFQITGLFSAEFFTIG